MFNSSGSMYEEIEQNRLMKLRKRKILKRRIIVIIILLIILSYLGILLNDIRRFRNGDNPLIILSSSTKEYDDGKVESYYSLGWVFRNYARETINTQELVPFWTPIAMDDVLNRTIVDESLPKIESYKIPDNKDKRSKVGGVLFFYDKDQNLLGTYKCILSENECEVTVSAYLDEDRNVRQVDTVMDYIDNRYVFISEYKSRNTSVEEKTVYLYDMKAKHIIAQYEDVRYSRVVEKDYNKYIGINYGSKFIAKKDNYWGVDEVNKGMVSNFVNYEYKLINFDEETNLYILSTKQGKWVVFNPNNNVYTSPIDKIIESVHYKNEKAYVVAYEKVGYNTKNYYLYDEDGNNVLIKEDVDNLVAYDDFLIYAKGDTIYIINYDGQEAVDSLKLYISLDDALTYKMVRPYSVDVIGKTLKISIPKSQDKTHFVDVYQFDIDTLELIKKVENIKETSY